MKRLILILAAAIALVPAVAMGGLLGYKWQPAPIHMTVYASVSSPVYQQAVVDSVAMWNASPYVEMTIEWGECQQNTRGAIAVCERPEVCQYNYAQLSVRGDKITSATIYLNSACNDFSLPYEIFLGSVCEGMGHTVGLAHNTDPESCMGSGYGVSAGDLADLTALYGRK